MTHKIVCRSLSSGEIAEDFITGSEQRAVEFARYWMEEELVVGNFPLQIVVTNVDSAAIQYEISVEEV